MHYLIKDNIPGKYLIKVFAKEGAEKEPPHSHEYLQLWYVVRGSCTHTVKGHTYTYTRGGVMILPSDVEHSVVSEETTLRICCEFSERFVSETLEGDGLDLLYLEPFLLGEHQLNSVFRVGKQFETEVERILYAMMDEYRENSKYSGIFLKANLLKLLAIIAREYDRSATDGKEALLRGYRDGMARAIRYAEEHLAEKLYLSEVCRVAAISQSAFSELFKQMTGKTFSEYVSDRRVALAQEQLETTAAPLSEIALSCGFYDSAYFSRIFKRKLGITPTEYRKRFGK